MCDVTVGVLFTAVQTVGTNDRYYAAQEAQKTRRRKSTSDVSGRIEAAADDLEASSLISSSNYL